MEHLCGVEYQTNIEIKLTNAWSAQCAQCYLRIDWQCKTIYLSLLPLTKSIKLLQGKFMWKLLSKKHPDSIIEQLPLHFKKTINNTNCEKLIIPYYRTSIGKKNHYYLKDTKSGIPKSPQTSKTKKAITILLKITISIY